MKPLLLILCLAFVASAQTPDWKFIKEMSGDIPNHQGLTIEFYAAEIARSGSGVKLLLKAEFPGGAPVDLFRDNAPSGFDISSVSRIVVQLKFNCDSLIVKPIKGSAEIYQFNGNHIKSKEPPFGLDTGHVFVNYFCEQGEKPTIAPKLKQKP
jgi:hypothetical protein